MNTKPGDLCVFVRDSLAAGRNIGKQCVVQEVCACFPDCWTSEAMEPVWAVKRGEFHLSHCHAGQTFCCPKTNLRPLRDPDRKITREDLVLEKTR
jgi:hypothetical protein